MTEIDRTALCGKVTACRHQCLYCLMGSPAEKVLDWNDYTAVVERYMDWAEKAGRNVSFEVYNNYDLPMDRYRWLLNMGRGTRGMADTLLMGGMRKRTQDEMVSWLTERMDTGLEKVIFSMNGLEETHDRMNGRKGDFQYLVGAQKAAASLGLKLIQRMFITKENLEQMEPLCEMLDGIAEPFIRSIYPLHYKGRAKELEEQRIDEEDIKKIPSGVMKYMMPEQLKSEREWVDKLSDSDEPYADKIDVHFMMKAEHITMLMNTPCDTIIDSINSEAKEAYGRVPGLRELCRRYGEKDSTKIYEGKRKIALVWLERFIEDSANGIDPRTADVLRSGFVVDHTFEHKKLG